MIELFWWVTIVVFGIVIAGWWFLRELAEAPEFPEERDAQPSQFDAN